MMKMLLAVLGVAAIAAGAGAAQAAPRANAQPASTPAGAIGTASANVVYDEYGRYAGADPDPIIRFQLRREAEALQRY
jgi:hypothetical protein